MHRWIVAGIAAAGIAAATPAAAAVLFERTVTAQGGIAELFEDSTVGHLLAAGSTWVGISGGQFVSANWTIDGQLAKLWWDEFGGGVDDDGNGIPALTGNEYIYSPSCDSTTAVPVCGTVPLRTILTRNLLRIDFAPPPDFNRCTPVFTGDTSDCAEFYTFGRVDYDLFAAAPGDVTFTFYDAAPLAPVPEPATWALLIAGFALTGGALRHRRSRLAV